MTAILAGLATALCWALSITASSRAARRIGAWSTLAGVMLVGMVIAAPAVVVSGRVTLAPTQIALVAIAGIGNVIGLLLNYTALRGGKVAVVAPIVSTEGAITGLIALIAGERLSGVATVVLPFLAVGVVLAARERDADVVPGLEDDPRRTALLAIAAAAAFGLSVYATGRLGVELPVAWAVLPARLAGVVLVALPLIVRGRLVVTRSALPFVIVAGLAEVAGFTTFALGSRASIATTAVIASGFAPIAAIAGVVLFRERLQASQVVGIAIIAIGVAVLSAGNR